MEPTRLTNRFTDKLPCVWMQGGVVKKKFCENDYLCSDCHFDKVLKRVAEKNMRIIESGEIPYGKRGTIVSWKGKLRDLPAARRPCIQHMKGRIPFKVCTNDYYCGNCDFDQCFNDQYMVNAVITPVSVFEVEGFKVPQGYYIHSGHMWAKAEEGSNVRVGIDDFAARLLGPLDHIEAPLIGKEVKQGRGDTLGFRGKRRAGFLSPVTGVVTAVNTTLRDKGEIANKAPFSEGWIMNVYAPTLRDDMKNLMINRETKEFIKEEADRLYSAIEEVAGPLTTDGGQLGHDIYGTLPELGWDRLTRCFLHS
ncbi:MAG: glycine cleavage system protein H [Thermodesulfobacteriota bacterium]|nr:glycine cleavage system protein H [Thermodesulfobacteriota bacterium]